MTEPLFSGQSRAEEDLIARRFAALRTDAARGGHLVFDHDLKRRGRRRQLRIIPSTAALVLAIVGAPIAVADLRTPGAGTTPAGTPWSVAAPMQVEVRLQTLPAAGRPAVSRLTAARVLGNAGNGPGEVAAATLRLERLTLVGVPTVVYPWRQRLAWTYTTEDRQGGRCGADADRVAGHTWAVDATGAGDGIDYMNESVLCGQRESPRADLLYRLWSAPFTYALDGDGRATLRDDRPPCGDEDVSRWTGEHYLVLYTVPYGGMNCGPPTAEVRLLDVVRTPRPGPTGWVRLVAGEVLPALDSGG
jgi:hypothetical protein